MSNNSYIDEYSVAMTDGIADQAAKHLLRYVEQGVRQEELCFALWRPSKGDRRFTGLLYKLILPENSERSLTGNASFAAEYLERAIRLAREDRAGVALLHNHFTPGWQPMSPDDVRAEQGRAAAVLAGTDLPFLGLTLGTDGAWSARFWPRVAPKTYVRKACANVRVVGTRLALTYHPDLMPVPSYRDELRRTINVWGDAAQADLSRLHVGVVGLGSVGRLVSEGLARMGVRRVTLIDFDRVERHNLDRLLGASTADANGHRLKVELAAKDFASASTAESPEARAVPASVVEPIGYEAALNCDVLFSCVDRPWGRRVLNHIAYAHLIPVIDGGILARVKENRFRGTEWSIRTAGPGRACLACVGAYNPSFVETERDGKLDDPSYIEGLHREHPLRCNENVFPFSMAVAAHELLHLVAMVAALLNMPDLGDQRYHYNLREMKVEERRCQDGCEFCRIVATADTEYHRDTFLGEHDAAKKSRAWIAPSSRPPTPADTTSKQLSIWERIRRLLFPKGQG